MFLLLLLLVLVLLPLLLSWASLSKSRKSSCGKVMGSDPSQHSLYEGWVLKLKTCCFIEAFEFRWPASFLQTRKWVTTHSEASEVDVNVNVVVVVIVVFVVVNVVVGATKTGPAGCQPKNVLASEKSRWRKKAFCGFWKSDLNRFGSFDAATFFWY